MEELSELMVIYLLPHFQFDCSVGVTLVGNINKAYDHHRKGLLVVKSKSDYVLMLAPPPGEFD